MTASIAYWTLTVYGGFFTLSVLPCLFKPWDLGVKIYMPLNLPTDPKSIKQLTYMQAFMAVGFLSLTGMFILAAQFMLTKTFVTAFVALFVVAIGFGVMELKGLAGVDPKALGAQLGLQIIVVALLAISLLTEEYDTVAAASPTQPDISGMLTFVGGFFIVANVAGIFVPGKLMEQYIPDEKMRPPDKYSTAQLNLFIRFTSWCNTTQGAFLLIVAQSDIDYYPFVILQLVMSPLFVGFFIAFMKAELGFDDKAMLFWLIFITFINGYFALALQLH